MTVAAVAAVVAIVAAVVAIRVGVANQICMSRCSQTVEIKS